MSQRPVRRAGLALLGALLLLLVTAGPAAADAPRPTDYRSSITGVDPALPTGVEVRIIGGDSLIELSVPRGTTAEVADYPTSSEADPVPYLRFDADGTVRRNALAVATTANDTRYGSSTEVPDPDAEPEWETVATDGTYAWHDHRIHWMSPTAPRSVDADGRVDLGGADGTWSVPLTVDGTETTITGTLVLESEPNLLPSIVVVAVGLAAAVLLARRAGLRAAAVLGTVTGALAVVIAHATWTAVPAEAGGTLIPVAVAAVAVIAGLLGVLGPAPLRLGAVAATAASLLGWGVVRSAVLTHAVLPTDIDPWIDRGATAAAIGVGAGLAVALLRKPQAPPVTASPSA